MSDDNDDDKVIVMRGIDSRPVAVPTEVVKHAERPYRAYLARQAGHSWEMIALAEGYADWKAARSDVRLYIEEGASLIADSTRKQLMEMEIARLDALQAAVWPSAMEGNLSAVNSALSVIVSRAKLLQLDKHIIDDKGDQDATGGAVVIPADDDGYQRGLRTAAGEH